MKGHTHEDVDAMFGNVRTWLQRHDATTLPGKQQTSNIIESSMKEN